MRRFHPMWLDWLYTLAVSTFVGVFSLGVFGMAIRRVHVAPGQVAVVTRFGSFERALTEGTHTLWPFIERLRARLLSTGEVVYFTALTKHIQAVFELQTADEVTLVVHSTVHYRIVDVPGYTAAPLRNSGRLREKVIAAYTAEAARTDTYSEFARHIRASDSVLPPGLHADSCKSAGVELLSVAVGRIQYPQEIEERMNERAMRSTEVEADIERIKSEAKKAAIANEAKCSVERLRANHTADMQMARAQADADAIRYLVEATGQSLADLAAWRRASSSS